MILFAVLGLTLNILDSVTTNIAFRQYPDKELKGEGNPMMRWLMLKSKVLSEVVKQGAVLGMVILFLVANDMTSLRIISLALGFVVLNNTYVVISRHITKKKVISPLMALQKFLHIPKVFTYALAICLIVLCSYALYGLIWGFR